MQSKDAAKHLAGIELYSRASQEAAGQIIRTYSTSFSKAASLLPAKQRQHITNIYALVRIADEIVDGAAAGAIAQGGRIDPAFALDRLENEVSAALTARFSTNPIVHAFALTANEVGFGRTLIQPFFTSMRMDLDSTSHNATSFKTYVYGSAEVVGLMCLQAFIQGVEYSIGDRAKLTDGAKALGSAFQKVNFLRDLAADFESLGRSYFPGIKPNNFDDAAKQVLVDDIQADIDVAVSTLHLLPRGSRRAVVAALLFFKALNDQIAATPADQLMRARISVPNWKKLVILVQASLGSGAE